VDVAANDKLIQNAWIHPSYAVDGGNNGTVVSEGSYDVGVLEAGELTNQIPALSNPLSAAYAADGQVGMLVGYGRNVFEDTVLRKQFTGGSGSQLWAAATRAEYGASATNYTHNLLHTETGRNRQWAGGGDSGGPNLRQTTPGVWQVIGVLSSGSLDDPNSDPARSQEARVSNTRLWISNPHNVSTSIIVASALGFLENRHMLQCIGTSGSPLSSGLFDCDGRNQPVDNQYWKLVVAESPYYRLQNMKNTGFCLQANANPTSVTPVACANVDAQKWQFVASAANAFQLRPKSAPGECLDWNTALAIPLSHTTCNSSKVKDWYFYR
jgi:hypothetical protein